MTTITKLPDGGAAFPGFQFTEGHGPNRRVTDPMSGDAVWENHAPGMSLRDYFAAQAMQALLSVALKNERSAETETIAGSAFRMADAMLETREK